MTDFSNYELLIMIKKEFGKMQHNQNVIFKLLKKIEANTTKREGIRCQRGVRFVARAKLQSLAITALKDYAQNVMEIFLIQDYAVKERQRIIVKGKQE